MPNPGRMCLLLARSKPPLGEIVQRRLDSGRRLRERGAAPRQVWCQTNRRSRRLLIADSRSISYRQ